MKKNFYLLFLLTAVINLSAQTPGGVSGSVLWLKANTDASAATWADKSNSGNDFTQALSTNRPALTNNVFNFNPAMSFNGSNSYMVQPTLTGFPTGNGDRSVFVVANATATNSYRWILTYGTPGYPPGGGTYQIGNQDGLITSAFYASLADLSPVIYWYQPQNLNGGMVTFTMASNQEILFDRGSSIGSQLTSATLTATSINGVLGALNDPMQLPAVSQFWSGAIAEVIMFPTALSDADRNKVESYLAIKYGFTLGTPGAPANYTASDGTVFWTGSATFQNDIFGIGTDATGTGLTQTQSNSTNSGNGNGTGQYQKGNMILSTATPLTEDQFLLIGNDAGFLIESTISSGQGPVTAEGSSRLVRNWKIQNTGSVGAVDLTFDTTGFTLAGGATLSNYILMIDNDGNGNYADGPQTYIHASSSTGNNLNFTGVTLPNNAVFTIITSPSATLPAIWQGFTATVQKSKATLTWKTSNEINVDHYTAEYSTNGINFLTAGIVVAQNGAGINTYTLTQDNLPAGIRYYRIKRVDKDGKFDISETKSVKVGGAVSLVLKSNPIINGRLEINIDVPQNQDAVIRVVNIEGKILKQQNNGLSTGTNSISTSLSNIAAGTYFLQVQLSNEIINKKFVKL